MFKFQKTAWIVFTIMIFILAFLGTSVLKLYYYLFILKIFFLRAKLFLFKQTSVCSFNIKKNLKDWKCILFFIDKI